VQATLSELLVAADEQYVAVVAHDRERIESVTRQQERLAARLARAEGISPDAAQWPVLSVEATSSSVRARELHASIAAAVNNLRTRQARTTRLLEQCVELTAGTLLFLQRLVGVPNPVYGARGRGTSQHSVLVIAAAWTSAVFSGSISPRGRCVRSRRW